jgi:hypothetical protein
MVLNPPCNIHLVPLGLHTIGLATRICLRVRTKSGN